MRSNTPMAVRASIRAKKGAEGRGSATKGEDRANEHGQMGCCNKIRFIQLVALFGVAVACYAWHVETKLVDPMYEPACSGVFGGNCGTVGAAP
eukprot:SAG22_NODE_20_length_32168_cov_40.859241_5_plen_93_part_00